MPCFRSPSPPCSRWQLAGGARNRLDQCRVRQWREISDKQRNFASASTLAPCHPQRRSEILGFWRAGSFAKLSVCEPRLRAASASASAAQTRLRLDITAKTFRSQADSARTSLAVGPKRASRRYHRGKGRHSRRPFPLASHWPPECACSRKPLEHRELLSSGSPLLGNLCALPRAKYRKPRTGTNRISIFYAEH